MTPVPDTLTLGQLLSMSALLGGTIEYAEVLKRRASRRREVAEREESGDIGLQGLVRVLLTEGEAARKATGTYQPE